MKIMMDGLLLFLNNNQVGNYCRSIVDNLIKYSNIHLDIIKDYEIDSTNYKNNSIELLLNRKSNDYSNLHYYFKNNNYDLYHCLNNGFSIPKNFDFNYVMSMNNLLPISHEELCSQSYIHKYFSKVPFGVLNSSYIICPSLSTKETFLESFSMDESKVLVNYGVVSDFYKRLDPFLSSVYIKSKFNIENEFIVFCGDFHKRKKLEKCLILHSKLRNHIFGLKFLILSFSFSDLTYLQELKDLSKKLDIADDVIFISNISVMDKVNLFSRCLFFIDLSLYEDINLDIVEAFSCKAPIICSSINLYKEYFGDSVYYNDFMDPLNILNYAYKYNYCNEDLILSKFKNDINIKSALNIYNKIIL